MAQTSVQYTPVQVLQAARRAEAEGKMDYALQFYRHLVEHHGTTSEAQEARDGLFRIAEWRWGEARIARRQEVVNGGQAPYQQQQQVAQQQADYSPEPHSRLPQIIAREVAAKQAEAEGRAAPYKARFRVGKIIATLVSGLGWATVTGGFLLALFAGAGLSGDASAGGILGLPVGVLLGFPTAVAGLFLVVTGQLAAAVFESTNATLELVALGRGKFG